MILNCRFLSAFEKATAASPPMVFSSWFTSLCYATRSGNHWSFTEQLHQTRDLMLLNSIEDSSFAIEVRCYLKYRYCISYPPRWIIIIIIIITCIIVIYLLVLSSSSASAHYYHHQSSSSSSTSTSSLYLIIMMMMMMMMIMIIIIIVSAHGFLGVNTYLHPPNWHFLLSGSHKTFHFSYMKFLCLLKFLFIKV